MSDKLVSIGLPVRNAAGRLEEVVWSVLAQDHEHIELVISDNGSTDDTEEVCRALARSDNRIVYHRFPENVGLLNNFMQTMKLATGTYFRWIGDDDWLAPDCVAQCLKVFAEDERLILVTTKVAYTGEDGTTESGDYDGAPLRSADPITRFSEMLRLLNESHLMIDPLYALMRREPVVAIPRRNMLREDQVFATKLALAGPWGHVPEVLAHRNWKSDRLVNIARRLDVPTWQVHLANALQARETLRWIPQANLTPSQQRAARAAVARMYLRRQGKVAAHRTRKLARMSGLVRR
jgi:glycosyltransferase involved in cell wall biosynthesis